MRRCRVILLWALFAIYSHLTAEPGSPFRLRLVVDQGAFIRTGSAWRLIAGQFASLGAIGFAMAVFTVSINRHSSPPAPTPDQVIAYSVAGCMVLIGVAGFWRSTRLGLRIGPGDEVTVRGVARTKTVQVSHVTECGFGSTSYGRCLYMVDKEGRSHFVLGVSHRPRQDPPSRAAAALDRIRGSIPASSDWATDPLPELAVVEWTTSSDRPAGSVVSPPMIARLILWTLQSLLGASAVILVVFAGFQAGVPHTFPWVLVVAVALLLLFGLGPVVVIAVVAARGPRFGVAIGDTSISVIVRRQWQTMDLREMVGIGTKRTAHAVGPFCLPRTLTSLVLVDGAGHRMELAFILLRGDLVNAIRQHTGSNVKITPSAAGILTAVPKQ